MDNVIKGLELMAQFTLFGYAFIHIYRAVLIRMKNRRKW